MKRLLILCRKYPLSALCVAVIWILCVMPIPETPLDHVRFIDKWTHLVMYAGLCAVIWLEMARHGLGRAWKSLLLYAVAMPILMGGLIELVQAYCTGGNRSGEWLDWAADSVGVLIGQLIGMLLAACVARYRRGRVAG